MAPLRHKKHSTQINLKESYVEKHVEKLQPKSPSYNIKEVNVRPVVHQSLLKLPQLEEERGPQSKGSTIDQVNEVDPKIRKIQNYNPIKKDEFLITDTYQKD